MSGEKRTAEEREARLKLGLTRIAELAGRAHRGSDSGRPKELRSTLRLIEAISLEVQSDVERGEWL